MTWTCEQTELLLTDYLDGLLQPEQQHAFDLHVNSCERCTPLVSSVAHAIASLRALPELETPPRFVYNILDATLGPRETVTGWAAVRAWVRGLASPRSNVPVKSSPSTTRSDGTLAPAKRMLVVNKSMRLAMPGWRESDLILPGHHAMPGTRMPPSHVLPLPSRNNPAEPPC